MLTNGQKSLVRALFDGPIDIVGDVHGEFEALNDLLGHLGYAADGSHPNGRRLVFLGDLTDRGPDSPAVVERVKNLVDAGRAQCVLGNHDLNILLGDRKHDNHWFFGEEWSLAEEGSPITPAVLADEGARREVVAFFRRLPLALEREDVRVVHSCWDDAMIDIARDSVDVVDLCHRWQERIEADLEAGQMPGEYGDDPERLRSLRMLEHQNRNPVKVLTSGKERRVEEPFKASGKLRYEARVPWWEEYDDGNPLCVFGHYGYERGTNRPATNFSRRGICADFAVANRWRERTTPGFDGRFSGSLGAVRLPECHLVFDNGDVEQP